MGWMDWLEYIIQGGALVILTVVLYGVWQLGKQLLDIMRAQAEYIQSSTAVQAKLCEQLSEHEDRAQDRDRRAETRHAQLLQNLQKLNGKAVP
jgi:homoserine dehydrogenase